jgi:molybdate transport system ATP-binding protein
VLEACIQKQFADRLALDVAFEAPAGFTIVFGASGAGKTTLLNCVAGLARPNAGRIAASGRVFFDDARRLFLSVAQRKVGYVFQDLALFPHLTAEQNIAYGLAHLDRSTQQRCVSAILASFRIEHLRNRKPAQISGGERQRVALARALVTDPSVLLLDEPLAALDLPTKAQILDDLRTWSDQHRVPILYVTHNRDEVFALGERVLILDQGRILAQGTPHEVMTAPRLETVAQLSGFENIFDTTVEAVHEDRGTMTCRIMTCRIMTCGVNSPVNSNNAVTLETPLIRAAVGTRLRIGIRAGDILLATREPHEISARNIIPGRVTSVDQRDVIILARVACGPDHSLEIAVQLTLAARDSLRLAEGREVWLVLKTHSCHLMAC